MLLIIGNATKFLRGNSFPKENLICYISETKGHRKLKFGEVSLQISQNFLKKTEQKISDLNTLLTFVTATLSKELKVIFFYSDKLRSEN